MKKMHIIGIILIGVAISAMIMALGDATSYVNFEEARANPDRKIHVIGELAPGKEIYYNPIENPDYFTFYLIDNQGEINRVVHYDAKPQDFERSDEVVVIGNMQGDDFVAQNILMKCPSKYNEEFTQADKK